MIRLLANRMVDRHSRQREEQLQNIFGVRKHNIYWKHKYKQEANLLKSLENP